MPPINLLIKPASGNCNLRCKYCFYKDVAKNREKESYGFMSEETLSKVLEKSLAYAEGECVIAYQGGEPTLIGLDFFKKSLEYEKLHNINNVKIVHAIQTNGYTLNKEWVKFFKENNFLVGISLDGNKATHDEYRKNLKEEGTFYRVLEGINLLKKYEVDFNILTVVNSKTVNEIEKIYKFYRKNNLNFMQFIPCLDKLNKNPGEDVYSITPKEYGDFLNKLFDLWFEDFKKGNEPYIRTFDNYLAIILGYLPEACEHRGICNKQYIIESDGEVYPCDFYVLDKYKLGNLNFNSINEIDNKRMDIKFIEHSMIETKQCKSCNYFKLCRGGCKRNRVEFNNSGNYINYFCQSYKMFFEYSLDRLISVANFIKYNKN